MHATCLDGPFSHLTVSSTSSAMYQIFYNTTILGAFARYWYILCRLAGTDLTTPSAVQRYCIHASGCPGTGSVARSR